MTNEELLEKRAEAFATDTGEGYYNLALYYDEANDKEPNKYSFRSLYFYWSQTIVKTMHFSAFSFQLLKMFTFDIWNINAQMDTVSLV